MDVATEPRKRDGGSRETIIDWNAQCGAYRMSLAPELGDRRGTSGHAVSNLGARLEQILWTFLPPVLRIPLAECRNLPHRIRVGRELWWDTSTGYSRVPEDLARESESLPDIRTYRHAYIRDMILLQEQFPSLTEFDLHIARRSWNYGTQSCESTSCSCTLSDQSRSYESGVVFYAAPSSSATPQHGISPLPFLAGHNSYD